LKKYDDLFSNDSFYIYIRPYENILTEKQGATPTKDEAINFYEKIEKIFIAVASKFAAMPELEFHEYAYEFEKARRDDELEKLKKELEEQYPDFVNKGGKI